MGIDWGIPSIPCFLSEALWGKKAWYNWLLILKELICKTRNKQKVLVILSLYRMISPYVWNTSFPVKDLKANIPDVLQLLSWKSQIAYWSSFVYLECFLSYKKYKSKYSQHTWFFILKEAQRKQWSSSVCLECFIYCTKHERKHFCTKLYNFL